MDSNKKSTKEDLSKYDWISLRNEMDEGKTIETAAEKFRRKFSEEPFIPIGALATATALSVGLWSFRTGRRKLSQYMMRTRIVAQGFTVAALVFGILMGAKGIAK
ncbi:HIG1 domain family member 2A, mitochondrial [Cylas formicarius]|uniref:HIG1 domain family member 2A, mitochondrial n=1 Tax=Cylas formicarius TaxID=197179 RepID=UPI002958C5F9|nr:HIG1 domain family member 2A, mitochondrial [Cylas formicarius]